MTVSETTWTVHNCLTALPQKTSTTSKTLLETFAKQPKLLKSSSFFKTFKNRYILTNSIYANEVTKEINLRLQTLIQPSLEKNPSSWKSKVRYLSRKFQRFKLNRQSGLNSFKVATRELNLTKSWTDSGNSLIWLLNFHSCEKLVIKVKKMEPAADSATTKETVIYVK